MRPYDLETDPIYQKAQDKISQTRAQARQIRSASIDNDG